MKRANSHLIHDRFYCNYRYAAATGLDSESRIEAVRLASRSVDILLQVCPLSSRLRVGVPIATRYPLRSCVQGVEAMGPTCGVSTVSSRTVMNIVGWAEAIYRSQPTRVVT